MVAEATGYNFIKDTVCSGSAVCYAAVEIGSAAIGLIGPNGASNAAKLATKADDVADVVNAIKGADKAGDVVNAIKGAYKGTDVVQSVAAGNRLDNAAEAGVVGSRVDSTAGTVSTHVDNSAVPAKPKSIIGGAINPNRDKTGDVYDARTGEWLDTLLNSSLGGTKR